MGDLRKMGRNMPTFAELVSQPQISEPHIIGECGNCGRTLQGCVEDYRKGRDGSYYCNKECEEQTMEARNESY